MLGYSSSHLDDNTMYFLHARYEKPHAVTLSQDLQSSGAIVPEAPKPHELGLALPAPSLSSELRTGHPGHSEDGVGSEAALLGARYGLSVLRQPVVSSRNRNGRNQEVKQLAQDHTSRKQWYGFLIFRRYRLMGNRHF